MFTFGLFGTLGFSPGGVLFNIFVNETEKYVQYAAIIALLILVWFMHDSIITPIKTMWRGYRVCGGLGIIGMLFAFLSGFTIVYPSAVWADPPGSGVRRMVHCDRGPKMTR